MAATQFYSFLHYYYYYYLHYSNTPYKFTTHFGRYVSLLRFPYTLHGDYLQIMTRSQTLSLYKNRESEHEVLGSYIKCDKRSVQLSALPLNNNGNC
jgi:hypothetical protein